MEEPEMNALAILGSAALAVATPEKQLEHGFFFFGMIAWGLMGTVALIASLLGILFMTMVVAPNATQRSTAALRERNILSFAAGVPVFAGFGLLGAATHGAPVVFSVVAVLFGIGLVLAFASASEDIGRRLFWAIGKDGSRASHLASGWLVFALGSLFPVIGWFLIFPYVSISGLGSLVTGFLRPKVAPAGPPRDVDFDVK
jgi:hypothetical protein